MDKGEREHSIYIYIYTHTSLQEIDTISYKESAVPQKFIATENLIYHGERAYYLDRPANYRKPCYPTFCCGCCCWSSFILQHHLYSYAVVFFFLSLSLIYSLLNTNINTNSNNNNYRKKTVLFSLLNAKVIEYWSNFLFSKPVSLKMK